MENNTLESRVYRLETQMTETQKQLGEVMDRAKNAHHRIDETQKDFQEFKAEMKRMISKLDTKVENIGLNLAEKERKDRKWHKWLIVIGVLALAAFVGTFIQDAGIKQTVGEIALKVGAGVASAV